MFSLTSDFSRKLAKKKEIDTCDSKIDIYRGIDKIPQPYSTWHSANDSIRFYTIRFNTHHFLKDFKGTV